MDKAIKADIAARTPKGWYGLASPYGWDDIVAELHTAIKALYPDYEVNQIKEKFGGLRFYCSVSGDDDVEKLIRAAEKKAAVTCQVCSEPGKYREMRGWSVTLCNPCLIEERRRNAGETQKES